jgi:beta-lactamase class D
VQTDNSISRYFEKEKLTGSFGLLNNNNGQFTIYNLTRFRDSAYLPASTFKIVNALVGIQTGRVKDDSTVIPWDGITRNIKEWNQNLNMKEAFHFSSVPWYQELARRIGKDTMQRWLDTLGYASSSGKAVIKQIDTFWLDNSVKVTADEQLGLVKKLYFMQLPFYKRTMEIVKDMMLEEDNSNYRLSYKTGWGHRENGHSIGWIVGWIEENRHPYFFSLQLESENPDYDFSKVRLKILKEILKQYGFMEGTK